MDENAFKWIKMIYVGWYRWKWIKMDANGGLCVEWLQMDYGGSAVLKKSKIFK